MTGCMRLRKPCEHDRYEEHPILSRVAGRRFDKCPGGEMLAEDALVIERVNGQWPEWITDPDGPVWRQCGGTDGLLQDIFDALANVAGDPGGFNGL